MQRTSHAHSGLQRIHGQFLCIAPDILFKRSFCVENLSAQRLRAERTPSYAFHIRSTLTRTCL